MLKRWESLPEWMRIPEVRIYYDILKKKRVQLLLKRTFDFSAAFILLVLVFPVFLIISCIILSDSSGGVFYRQERITAYGKVFWIHKFRTMVTNADHIGPRITLENDNRVTRIGEKLRKYRLDEIPQLIDILEGNMSFVGTRPEIPQYVRQYTKEMRATLLLPAGITSEASIRYKAESEILGQTTDADKEYLEHILPLKMQYNLEALKKFSFLEDIKVMLKTVSVLLRG